MCTLAWGVQEDSLWACFNRDEQRSRAPADPPRLYESRYGPVAYARDPDGGGTWLAASACAFAVALLNFYPRTGDLSNTIGKSRGLLVRELVQSESAIAAYNSFAETDPAAYAPFYLFIFSTRSAVGFSWDGDQLTFLDPEIPFWTTSSFQPETVCKWRETVWKAHLAKGMDGPEEAASLLRERHPTDAACGFTMDRPETRTCSQTLLRLSGNGFTFSYRSREEEGSDYSDPLIVTSPV